MNHTWREFFFYAFVASDFVCKLERIALQSLIWTRSFQPQPAMTLS